MMMITLVLDLYIVLLIIIIYSNRGQHAVPSTKVLVSFLPVSQPSTQEIKNTGLIFNPKNVTGE